MIRNPLGTSIQTNKALIFNALFFLGTTLGTTFGYKLMYDSFI
jgi:hypothetical protein